MARYEILCICRTARGEYGTLAGITTVQSAFGSIQFVQARDEGGRTEQFTKEDVIRRIRTREDSFFVTSRDASHLPHLGHERIAPVMIGRTPFGNEYIKTIADETHEDNLFALPECSNCDSYARGHAFTEGHDDEDSGNAEPDSESPELGPPDD